MRVEEYETLFRVEDSHWWYQALRRVLRWHLERYLPGWRGMPLLDAGCGTGGNLAHLAGPGSGVGLDRAAEALARCRRRGLTALVRGDVAALPFADASFAAVVSASVIYHEWVTDPGVALGECRRVLRPGGLLLVDVPASDALWSAHDAAVMTARRFRAAELRRLVEGAGFEVLRLTHWNTLLFPAVWVARRFRLSPEGRDFDPAAPPGGARNALLDAAMRLEAAGWRRAPLPFGVSIHCAARRRML
jgi:SAM-dependent methyltransferase